MVSKAPASFCLLAVTLGFSSVARAQGRPDVSRPHLDIRHETSTSSKPKEYAYTEGQAHSGRLRARVPSSPLDDGCRNGPVRSVIHSSRLQWTVEGLRFLRALRSTSAQTGCC